MGNLRRLNKDDITEAFEKFGKITDLWLATPPSGFGFLSFETPEEAEEAVRNMDGIDLHGTVIRVEFAKEPVGFWSFAFICRKVKFTENHTVLEEDIVVDLAPVVEDTIVIIVPILPLIVHLALVLVLIIVIHVVKENVLLLVIIIQEDIIQDITQVLMIVPVLDIKEYSFTVY